MVVSETRSAAAISCCSVSALLVGGFCGVVGVNVTRGLFSVGMLSV